MKRHPVLRSFLMDVLCTGLVLTVFALFHHVLPRQQDSLGIVIPNPYRTESTEDESGALPADGSMTIADAGISDTSTLSANPTSPPIRWC